MERRIESPVTTPFLCLHIKATAAAFLLFLSVLFNYPFSVCIKYTVLVVYTAHDDPATLFSATFFPLAPRFAAARGARAKPLVSPQK